MTVYELSPEQMYELKGNWYCEHVENPSWGEILDFCEMCPDDFMHGQYEGFVFSDDDFFCTAGR